jgi:hypothetical protein
MRKERIVHPIFNIEREHSERSRRIRNEGDVAMPCGPLMSIGMGALLKIKRVGTLTFLLTLEDPH